METSAARKGRRLVLRGRAGQGLARVMTTTTQLYRNLAIGQQIQQMFLSIAVINRLYRLFCLQSRGKTGVQAIQGFFRRQQLVRHFIDLAPA